MKPKRIFKILIILFILMALLPGWHAYAQLETPSAQVTSLLEELTPEERVGQLFLVTFYGTDTDIESQIYNLIVNHHVGGIILNSGNDNFISDPNILVNTHQLISNIQKSEWESSVSPSSESSTGDNYIPLFVGIEQEGNGYPTDQILDGLTAIPNAMSIGATWLPDLALQIGEIQGDELSTLGFNLYLGPSLDVLDSPNPADRGDIGTRAFGGDPYWVGEMGKAYIKGLHMGSNNRLFVVPKHFPGLGSSDRPIDDEIATVRKSLEQLKQIELAPFFAVTGNASDSQSTADGLLVSHIRFQGFQGNIRATTRPISFDQSALGEIIALDELSSWRKNGGLIVSDDLGSQAIRNFYSHPNQSFSAPLVARDVFLAGNDLLFLGNITSSDAEDSYSTTIDILELFVQRYRVDPTFAQQVDEAVMRILTRKFQLFGRFVISDVIVPVSAVDDIGAAQQPVFDIARWSATLISPNSQDLASLFPAPPALRDRIVIFTDTIQYQQCSECPLTSSLPVTAIQDAIVRLYGPSSGGQVSDARISSFTIDDLDALFSEADVETMEFEINRANWIVLALSDVSKGQPDIISRFLSERQDLLQEKRVVLFSFTAPYYFDATDISKLSAYYGLYSKQPAFIDVAARLLYHEITPSGYSPVSILSTGYDLIEITRPNPDQVISLTLDFFSESIQQNTPTAGLVPTPFPLLKIGDAINVRTGLIFDHNGHPVPNGTVVQFSMLLSGESGGIIQQVEQVTTEGVAQASIVLENLGLIEISVSSEEAILSETILIDVSSGQAESFTVIEPVPSEAIIVNQDPSSASSQDEFITTEGYPRLTSWILIIIYIAISSLLVYWAVSRLQSPIWGWRWGICVMLGGLVGYNLLGLFGIPQFLLGSGFGGILGISVLGELTGMGFAWIWNRNG
ncbi:MAG: glycoside hydrolase family 3 N-terminal domain-containing protein [Anaerolineae bacterium]|nr:glycoside hydrolase family 3 N-terminal domain-containing protein [Anaerolineae bacterium]